MLLYCATVTEMHLIYMMVNLISRINGHLVLLLLFSFAIIVISTSLTITHIYYNALAFKPTQQ